MDIQFVVGFAVLLFVLTLVANPLADRLRLPQSTFLVVLGAVAAYLITTVLGVDTGLRASSFHDLIFFVFLPVLIFDSAFKIPLRKLADNLGVILFLAIVGMLLTTGISAAMLYVGIGHPTGFPWIAALLAGALLAATDPVAVVAQLKNLGAPERLGVMLEGESLFNDATAIVVFGILLTLALMPGAEVSALTASVEFMRVFLGGALIGVLIGGSSALLIRGARDAITCTTVTLTAAYGSFLLAEAVAHVSGVMGSLVSGLILARAMEGKRETIVATDTFWGTLAYMANGSVFLLMGVTVTVGMFTERWLAMLIAIAAVLIARVATIYGCLAPINLMLRRGVPLGQQTAIVWGGLRGAVTLGLALSLPVELDYWWTIQSMAFGVVLFTLLVQAPTMPAVLRKTNLAQDSSAQN